MGKEGVKIEIMDTTLRDGEQTSGVSFMPHEKLLIARLLLQELNVDRIEVASARVSEGEKRAVSLICKWARSAGMQPRVEVLGFVDHTTSVDWIRACGGQCINLLCKGSLKHCRHQLKKSPEEHLADILQTLEYAHSRQVEANIYLEDWSNGIQESPDYVFFLIDHLRQAGIRRFMLPDTLGVLNPPLCTSTSTPTTTTTWLRPTYRRPSWADAGPCTPPSTGWAKGRATPRWPAYRPC